MSGEEMLMATLRRAAEEHGSPHYLLHLLARAVNDFERGWRHPCRRAASLPRSTIERSSTARRRTALERADLKAGNIHVLHAAHMHGGFLRLGNVPVLGDRAGERCGAVAETDLDVGGRDAVSRQCVLDLFFPVAARG